MPYDYRTIEVQGYFIPCYLKGYSHSDLYRYIMYVFDL